MTMLTKREYKELYLLHYKKAALGNVESQFKLGEFYEHGRGVLKDYKLAQFWYRKAADGDHPLALLNLNWVRLKELGVDRNEGQLTLFADCTPSCRKYESNCRCLMRMTGDCANEKFTSDAANLDFLHVSKPFELQA